MFQVLSSGLPATHGVALEAGPTPGCGWNEAVKTIPIIIGAVAVAMGLLWVGQGTGLIHWPASSFMLDQRPWALRGAALAAVGVALILWARRRIR